MFHPESAHYLVKKKRNDVSEAEKKNIPKYDRCQFVLVKQVYQNESLQKDSKPENIQLFSIFEFNLWVYENTQKALWRYCRLAWILLLLNYKSE